MSFLLQNISNFLKELFEEKNKQNYVVIAECSLEVKAIYLNERLPFQSTVF